MNLTYIIGVIASIVVMIVGMMFSSTIDAEGVSHFIINVKQIRHFADPGSIFIVVGCTIATIIASFPPKMIAALPRHFAILLNTKRYDPTSYIDQLVELAQIARKDGLLALENKASEQKDPFFRQAIMLIVDANDADKVRDILESDIDCMSSRHDGVASMYEKGSAVAPAFGMVGTLVGLINMLKNMGNLGGDGATTIGTDMGTALITTLYGCILAHIIFGPIASNLRIRDEEEVLCKMIIVEGIMSIQSGENPKFLKEKLLTFLAQKQRDAALGEGGKPGKKVKAPKQKKPGK